jgi:hemoglobin-like flavoprotein
MTTTQPAMHKPSAADLQAHAIVKRQFGTCCIKPTFLDDFYAEFTSQSPEIAAAFAKTDMKAQKAALRSGLSFLVMYAEGSTMAASKLDHLGGTHARTAYNIRPQLYPLWIESLIRTVKKHVPEFDRTSEAAWRQVLQLGVNRIKSWY